jgi:hypothetical protein
VRKRSDQRRSPGHRPGWSLFLVAATGIAVICQLTLTGAAAAAPTAKTAAVTSVAPNPVNDLDCNGWSPKYGSVRSAGGMDCTPGP